MRALAVALVLLAAWSVHAMEPPEFIKCADWSVRRVDGALEVSTTAIFYNPNRRGRLKVRSIDLEVFAADRSLGTIDQLDRRIKVRPQQPFEIPLRITVRPDASRSEVVRGLYAALTGQSMVFHVRGVVKVTALFVRLKVRVDESQEVRLRDVVRGQ